MTDQDTGTPPAPWARTAGLLYVGTIVTGVFSAYFVRQLVVRGDAVATAHNLIAHESLFRLGIVSELIGIMCYVAVTMILYDMLKPVNRRLSLLAAFFSIVGCAIGAVDAVNDLAPLALLSGMPYLHVFTPDQLQTLAYTFVRLGGQLNTIGLLFFAFYCVLIGGLIVRSTFIPRFVGVIMALAGVSWLISNSAIILLPALGATLSPLAFAGIAGEATLTLWLLVMGINVPRWQAQANAAKALYG